MVISNNEEKITSAANFNTVIFKQYANEGALRKFTSLFPGLGYAAGYKVGDARDLASESC